MLILNFKMYVIYFYFFYIFSLIAVTSRVIQVNELVQVETYLRSEGVLVRYWYPIDMLERPPVGYRRMATNGLVTLDSTNIQIHR